MTGPQTIGVLVGYAERAAIELGEPLDRTYKARLAKHIKQELERNIHPDDIRWAIRLLLERKPRLSPFLLKAKVDDVRRYQPVPQEAEYDPLGKTPRYEPSTPVALEQ